MKVFDDFEQYTDRWFQARRGVPTASNFHRIITAKKMELAAGHDTYINELIGEIYDLEYPAKDDVATSAMRRGSLMEPKARRMYEYRTGCNVRQAGFVLSDCERFGYSPDALSEHDTIVVECKNPTAATHVGWVRAGVLPDDHRAQVHAPMALCKQIKAVDFISCRPGFEPFIVRAEPDAFTAKLKERLEEFWDRFQTALLKFRPAEAKEAA